MLTKATEFRSNAVDCRRNAVQAVNSFDRQYWLDVGAHWTKMAMAEEIAEMEGFSNPSATKIAGAASVRRSCR